MPNKPAPHTEVTVSTLPKCDIHRYVKHTPPNECPDATYDGKTIHGPWANMCGPCFATYGIGLGLGKGQRLVLEAT